MENNQIFRDLMESWGLDNMIERFQAAGVFNIGNLYCMTDEKIARLFPNSSDEYSFRVKWVEFCHEFGHQRDILNEQNLEMSKRAMITPEGIEQLLFKNYTTRGILTQYDNTQQISTIAKEKVVEVIIESLLLIDPRWGVEYQKIIAQSLVQRFPTIEMIQLFKDPIGVNDSPTGIYIRAEGLIPAVIRRIKENYRRRTL